MDRKRSSSCDQAATSSPHLPKRQKSSRSDPAKVLSRNQYTIAWICALHMEMAAARAMLDEIHPNLPQDANDKNTYMLGSIGPHNIVIACLPNGQYGTNNATSVLTNLRWSFPSICMGFMVGIGGGAPTMADLRLGDVVVGTRVMPYDLGKVIEGGRVQRTASPKFPDQALLTVVSSIRAKHMLGPSRLSTILKDMALMYPGFSRPTSPDRLFLSTYSHDPQLSCCSECDQSKLLPRSRRLVSDPNIHYGAIASGNHVMKDSTTRDNVARELDIICFEMEAAGLMDVLPCLPIRGICDYSDSHKSKEWQTYAAAAAAAYARELIEILPANNEISESLYVANSPCQEALPNRRPLLLESFKFEQIDSRKISIKSAHAKTCRWFLKHPQYLEWLDPQKHAQHHGFLWIRGKPGAGKSTIMKFIYLKTKRKKSPEHALTASFFFHARGEYLEKSIAGMYRSLLLQLLEGYPDLQEVLDDTDLVPRGQTECPPLNILKDLFHEAASKLGQRSFTCFVDALDECDEQQVMEMVRYFEDLAESCASKGERLQICFSSRHYPYIRIRHGIELILEHQQGHSEDMDNYVQSNLQIRDTSLVDELRPQILEKAAGVFLWVVLVIDILNKENRRGRLALRKRLSEVPSGLTELFKDILRRDHENMEDLLLCILWILCAKRPLRPEEYYHALWSGLVLQGLADSEVPDATVADFGDCVNGHVITSSKGLAEITKAKTPTVQFIHESVRDFLIRDRGLQELWPDIGFDWETSGHERLKQCCSMYINHELVRASVGSFGSATRPDDLLEASKCYPFLEYASQYVLYHADVAARAIPQEQFLSQTSTPDWVTTINLFEKFRIRKYSSTASLIYILADKGLAALIRAWLQNNPAIDIPGERYKYPLFASLANGHKDAVAALLNSTSSICEGLGTVEGFGSKTGFARYKDQTPLTWAAQEGQMDILRLLLQKGTDIDEVDLQHYTPLMRASEAGHQAVVSFLIKEGAAVWNRFGFAAMSLAFGNGHAATLKLFIKANVHWDPDPESLQVALRKASARGNKEMAKFLIEEKVGIDAQDPSGHTALSIASRNGRFPMVELLIRNGAQIEPQPWSKTGRPALVEASECGHEAIVKFLLENGAEPNACDPEGYTPITRASREGHSAIIKLLLENGAEPNACDPEGHTAISRASGVGQLVMVKLLLERGAHVNPNAKGNKIQSALIEASKGCHEEVARLLIERGADTNAQDRHGKSPLHHIMECSRWPLTTIEPRYESFTKLLLENGAAVDARDFSGDTPLLHACRFGRIWPGSPEDIVRLLIDKGADIHVQDSEGSTPLHLAVKRHHAAMMKFLVDKGANVDAHDENGDTPRSLVKDMMPACEYPLFLIIGEF